MLSQIVASSPAVACGNAIKFIVIVSELDAPQLVGFCLPVNVNTTAPLAISSGEGVYWGLGSLADGENLPDPDVFHEIES